MDKYLVLAGDKSKIDLERVTEEVNRLLKNNLTSNPEIAYVSSQSDITTHFGGGKIRGVLEGMHIPKRETEHIVVRTKILNHFVTALAPLTFHKLNLNYAFYES